VNLPDEGSDALGLGSLYAGLAATFRYPAPGQAHVLNATEYLRAFDPAVSPTAVSLRESSYVDGEGSSVLEELVRFYEFFGLRRRPDALLPDHLSVELEFMHFLSTLESTGEPGRDTASLRRAQRDFLDRHLSRLIDAVGECGVALDSATAREAVAACRSLVGHHRDLLGTAATVR
jgi:DMSO reductase family type II enzyme chaperone